MVPDSSGWVPRSPTSSSGSSATAAGSPTALSFAARSSSGCCIVPDSSGCVPRSPTSSSGSSAPAVGSPTALSFAARSSSGYCIVPDSSGCVPRSPTSSSSSSSAASVGPLTTLSLAARSSSGYCVVPDSSGCVPRSATSSSGSTSYLVIGKSGRGCSGAFATGAGRGDGVSSSGRSTNCAFSLCGSYAGAGAGAGAGACACSAPPPELLRSVWLAQPASIALINNINSRLVLGRISDSPDHAGQGLLHYCPFPGRLTTLNTARTATVAVAQPRRMNHRRISAGPNHPRSQAKRRGGQCLGDKRHDKMHGLRWNESRGVPSEPSPPKVLASLSGRAGQNRDCLQQEN